MPETLTSPADASARAFRMNGAPRAVARRRPLPGSRAVVGGFLVAAAVVGVVAVASSDDGGPDAAYVVVTGDVDAGTRLRPDDLELVPLDLPPAQRSVSFTEPAVLEGATALSALSAGQLVQSSDVARPPAEGLAVLSLPVEPARALNGELQRGDRVDVLVTYTESGEPRTQRVAEAALVVDVVEAGGSALGAASGLSVSLAVPPGRVAAVAQAGAAGTVTLARTTGIPAR